MPHPVDVVFFQDDDGTVPVLAWLRGIADRRVRAKCEVRIGLLAENGSALRRPTADYLRDGIYELRVDYGRVHYRMLYCFDGRAVVVLTHALTKEREILGKDIDIALERCRRYKANRERHRYEQGAAE